MFLQPHRHCHSFTTFYNRCVKTRFQRIIITYKSAIKGKSKTFLNLADLHSHISTDQTRQIHPWKIPKSRTDFGHPRIKQALPHSLNYIASLTSLTFCKHAHCLFVCLFFMVISISVVCKWCRGLVNLYKHSSLPRYPSS